MTTYKKTVCTYCSKIVILNKIDMNNLYIDTQNIERIKHVILLSHRTYILKTFFYTT